MTLSAVQDTWAALANFRLAAILGWQDVAQRYRRSRIGAFWLTVNMGVMIGALGLVFGTIFRSPMSEFLPFICIGLILWSYFAQTINESCLSFISSSDTILQLPIPFFTYILKTWWKNTIIFAHNFVIFPIVMLLFGRFVDWHALIAIPGFVLASINLLWMGLLLAILCARYRDLTQIVQNIMQVGLYVTPIMWMPKLLPERASKSLLDWNPFYHLISNIREPLLGGMPTLLNWGVALGLAIVGWSVTLVFFNRYRRRIAYWL